MVSPSVFTEESLNPVGIEHVVLRFYTQLMLNLIISFGPSRMRIVGGSLSGLSLLLIIHSFHHVCWLASIFKNYDNQSMWVNAGPILTTILLTCSW